MLPIFEELLGVSFISKELRVIVKAMTYILNKPGDKYSGNKHREGMGEEIIGVEIYYPYINNAIEGCELELSIDIQQSTFAPNKTLQKHFKIKQGDLLVFSNECFHRLSNMKYPQNIY